MKLAAALVLAATSAAGLALADTAKPVPPLPSALAEHLGAAPADCPPGLEAYGRPASALCFTVALKEKPLKKARASPRPTSRASSRSSPIRSASRHQN